MCCRLRGRTISTPEVLHGPHPPSRHSHARRGSIGEILHQFVRPQDCQGSGDRHLSDRRSHQPADHPDRARTRNRRQSAQGGDQSIRVRGGERWGPASGVQAVGSSYFAFLTSPFFTPAAGKTHIAATMNTAVMITNIESSGRIGEPLQNASTAATISATAETPALTSVGTAIAPCLQLAPTGTAAASSGRRGAPRRFLFTNRVS